MDAAQVARADAIANGRELERALVLAHGAREDRLALACVPLGGKRALDFAERAHADLAVFGDRGLLLGGAASTCACSRPPRKSGCRSPAPTLNSGLSRLCSTNSSERDRGEVRDQRDARQPRRLRFLGAVERGGDAPLGGDDVGPPLEELRRQPAGTSPGQRGKPFGDRDRRGRIAPDQRFERAQRVLVGEIEAAHGVAQRFDVRLRDRDVVLVAVADAQAVARERHELLGRLAASPRPAPSAGAPRSRGTSPSRPARRSIAARIRRRAAPTRIAARSRAPSARTRPQRSSSQDANSPTPCKPGRVAAHLAAAAREQVHLRPQRRLRAGEIRGRRSTRAAATRRSALYAIASVDQRVELRIVERREPVVGDRARRRAGRRPLRRRRRRSATPASRISSRGGGSRSAQPAARARSSEDDARACACDQCSLRIR